MYDFIFEKLKEKGAFIFGCNVEVYKVKPPNWQT